MITQIITNPLHQGFKRKDGNNCGVKILNPGLSHIEHFENQTESTIMVGKSVQANMAVNLTPIK